MPMKITARRMSKAVDRNFDEEDLSDCFDICFGEGERRVFVMVRGDHVEISANHGQIIVRPRAGNQVWIDREKF